MSTPYADEWVKVSLSCLTNFFLMNVHTLSILFTVSRCLAKKQYFPSHLLSWYTDKQTTNVLHRWPDRIELWTLGFPIQCIHPCWYLLGFLIGSSGICAWWNIKSAIDLRLNSPLVPAWPHSGWWRIIDKQTKHSTKLLGLVQAMSKHMCWTLITSCES